MKYIEQSKLDKAARNRADIARIKRLYLRGKITREEAKFHCRPILDRINRDTAKKNIELNRKYGTNRKPPILDFVSAMRNSY